MLWGEPESLKFNLEMIDNMQKKLDAIAADLERLNKALMQEITTLKLKWRTQAGRKFTKNIDTDWSTQVEKYVRTINKINELLTEAKQNYQIVKDTADRISF